MRKTKVQRKEKSTIWEPLKRGKNSQSPKELAEGVKA